MQELAVFCGVFVGTLGLGLAFLIEREFFKRKIISNIEKQFRDVEKKLIEATTLNFVDQFLDFYQKNMPTVQFKKEEDISVKPKKRPKMSEETREKFRQRMIEMNKKRRKEKAEKADSPSPQS